MRAVGWLVVALAASAGPAWLVAPGGELPFGRDTSRLRFETPVADFGVVFAGERVTADFAFTNPSDRPVRIVEAFSTCGCVQAETTARWIDAGATGAVHATFGTDGRYGPQTLRIRVRTDEDPHAGCILTLRGSVRAVLRPRPPRLLLGALAPGSTIDETVDLEALEPISGLTAEPRGVDATVEGGRLRVRATVPFAVGTRFHGVLVRFRHAASGRDLEVWIPVVWTVPSPLLVEPSEVELAGGRAQIVVRPRWPGVASLAGVRVGDLPLEVSRRDEGDAVRLTLVERGADWEFPSSPALLLDVDPPSLGPVAVPIYLFDE